MKKVTYFGLVIAMSVLSTCIGALAAPQGVQVSGTSSSDTDTVLEQGKELYATGQYMAALDKFMKVLRRDPRQPEAREYLRLVVDELRQHRSNVVPETAPRAEGRPTAPTSLHSTTPSSTARQLVPSLPPSEQEAAAKLRKRQLLTTDLAAIPGVKVRMDSKNAFVEIETTQLFADRTGGLREEGVPLLDRVSAWLKTFTLEPIAIHCLPEETEDPSTGGALYLHRYAQLYGFFVDERKVPASRFIAAGPMSENSKPNSDHSTTDTTTISGSNARIVIVALGGADARGASTISASPSRWLEFSMIAKPLSFNPDEGEWATIDLAALAPLKARSWRFVIAPKSATKGTAIKLSEAVMLMEGSGNLFKRFVWDGRHQKAGRFVQAGNYLARLDATNADGASKSQEAVIEVKRSRVAVVALKPVKKPTSATPAKPKPAAPASAAVSATPVAATPSAPPTAEAPTAPADVNPAAESAPPTQISPETVTPAVEAAPEEEGATNAIWKQVIQFDENDSELKPSLKASLERIGKTLEVYPLQKVRITGFALSTETNPSALAKQRATRVRETLVSEYQVDPKRILVSEGRLGAASKVEISITN